MVHSFIGMLEVVEGERPRYDLDENTEVDDEAAIM